MLPAIFCGRIVGVILGCGAIALKRTLLIILIVSTVVGLFTLYRKPTVPDVAIPATAEAIERGQYLIHAGGCISCHQGNADGLSGGEPIESPFGTFYASNITPDPETGIGNWSGADFLRALKHGRQPNGNFYYPAFPYRSYAAVTDEDALDMAAWLIAQPPVRHEVAAHDLPGWIGRWQMAGWNLLADWNEPDFPTYDDPQLARGAYLARHLGHCGECHTPRSTLGFLQYDRDFGGGELDGRPFKGLDSEGLQDYSEEDLELFLFIGLKPDGEFVGGKMEPVIEHNTGQLTDEDRQAMAAFFKRGL